MSSCSPLGLIVRGSRLVASLRCRKVISHLDREIVWATRPHLLSNVCARGERPQFCSCEQNMHNAWWVGPCGTMFAGIGGEKTDLRVRGPQVGACAQPTKNIEAKAMTKHRSLHSVLRKHKLILRTIHSANQLSINGAVSSWCIGLSGRMQGQESTAMNMSITEENEQPSQPLNPQEAHQGQKEPRETADANT